MRLRIFFLLTHTRTSCGQLTDALWFHAPDLSSECDLLETPRNQKYRLSQDLLAIDRDTVLNEEKHPISLNLNFSFHEPWVSVDWTA